jgi:hypothetical protein
MRLYQEPARLIARIASGKQETEYRQDAEYSRK